MVSKYKISDKAILTDSDGTRDMIVDGTVYYNDSDGKTLTITNTIRSLSPDLQIILHYHLILFKDPLVDTHLEELIHLGVQT